MRRNDIARTVWLAGLQAAALVGVLLLLWRAAPVLKLTAVAAVVAAALESPVSWLVRHRWRRGVAIAAVGVTAIAFVGGAVAVVVPRVAPQVQDAADAAPSMLDRVQSSPEYRWLNRHAAFTRAMSEARKHAGAALGSVVAVASSVVAFGAAAVSVTAMIAFLLVSGPMAWRWLVRWIPPARRGRVRRVATDVRRAIAGYVVGALIMGAIAGSVTAVTAALLGVPFFLALATVTAALGIVPFIGAIISGILVVVVTLATSGSTAALVALGVFVAYQQLEGTVLQPIVQRHTTSMNGLVVMFAVLLGTSGLGVFGGIMALPVAAAGKVVANDALRRRRRAWRRGRTSSQETGRPGAAASPRH